MSDAFWDKNNPLQKPKPKVDKNHFVAEYRRSVGDGPDAPYIKVYIVCPKLK